MKLSIRSLILGGLITAQLASFAVLTVTVWLTAEDAARKQARSTLDGLSNLLTQETRQFFDNVEYATTLTQRLASGEIILVSDVEQIERYLFEIIKTNDQITGAFFANPEGEFVFVSRPTAEAAAQHYLFRRIVIEDQQRQEAVFLRDESFRPVSGGSLEDVEMGFDPRSRPWYEGALRSESVFWTAPYIFYSSRRPGISTAFAVRDRNRELVGVVGADVTLSRLSDFLRGLELGDGGFAFLTTGGGEVFAHSSVTIEPDGEALSLPTASDLGGALQASTGSASRLEKISPGEPRFLQFRHAGQSFLGLLFPVPSQRQDWLAGIVVPQSFFVGWFQSLGVWLGLAAAAMALAWGAAGYLVWRVIDGRLALIRGHAQRVLGGDLAPIREPTAGLAELRETELAVAKMIRGLDQKDRDNRALTQRLRKFFEGVEQSPVAVLMTDPAGRIEYVNPAFTALTGFEAGRAEGETPLLLASEEDDRAVYDSVVAALQRGQVWKGDLGVTTAEGEHLEIGVVAAPIKASDGQTVCCCAILHDKTIEKESQATIKAALEESVRANQAKTAFLAATSHELRTPLNAIIGFSEVMAAETFGPIGNDRYRKYSRAILESGRDLLGIISGILDLAAAESNRLLLIEDEVPLSQPLGEAIRMCHGVADRRSVEIEQVGGELPVMRLDALKCRQIFVNLIDNAIKSSPKGAAVTVAAEPQGDRRIVVDITDRGPGMSPAEARAVMQPFERLTRSASVSDQSGLGLGLPTAQAFARLHDADLQIFSAVGQGTTVRVTFPAERLVA
ncbi:MAG: cache domain-containing protein [Kiloniellales bacterium]|nr:cache domain-containing protein [Kiloniellales bacterium]